MNKLTELLKIKVFFNSHKILFERPLAVYKLNFKVNQKLNL